VVALSLRKTLKPQLFYAETSDGWKIALYRYLPKNGPIPGQAPILLCHGLGANRYNLDAPGRLSLARWLVKKGFECWVIELRGSGKSTRPTLFNGKKFNWNFDHYVNYDIPAALELIQQTTGQGQVHWIGHSMGGMVAYAYLITHDPAPIRSIVAIASPSFAHLAHPLIDRLTPLRRILKFLPRIPYAGASALLVPIMPLFRPTIGRLFANPKNMRTFDLQRLVAIVPQDLPLTLLAQVLDWYADKGFVDDYKRLEYFRELGRIKTPAFILAGTFDRLTPPADLRYVYDEISSKDKKFILFGRDSGCRHDYGHIDLVLGKYAREEIYPHIHQWLMEH
jgi:pimeloyl-ACP methyl ester carboxylesterase